MTENVLLENMESFENPDLLPLEELKLKVRTGGVVENIDALSQRWVNQRYFLHYEAPSIYNDNGCEITGAKERWMEIVKYMIDDLKWLLSLPFHRFWSNIVFNTSILDSLVSFLQEAPPFYALENFPNCPEMQEHLESLRRYVLLVFTRLVTNKKSSEAYMSRPFMGNLLYEKYIFTVPIIFDLCQLYGRENEKIVERILSCLFTLEPRYSNDLRRTVPCLIEAFENVETKFDSSSSRNINKAISLSERNTSSTNLTLFNLEDMILYVLDISSTLTVFLKCYSPAMNIFHTEDFMNKIVSIYDSTIPEMYKKLDHLASNDENLPKYIELKHRLDVTRIEILKLFRFIIQEPISSIQECLEGAAPMKIKDRGEEYLHFLDNVIGEKEFITDYDAFYPVQHDLEVLSNMCREVDTMKCEYILRSIKAITGKINVLSDTFSNNEDKATPSGPIAGSSGVQQSQSVVSSNNASSSNTKRMFIMKKSVEFASLVTEVKDLLPNLDEHFIELCLNHYDYNTVSVLNAILEDELPPNLKELKDLKLPVNDVMPNYTEDTFINEDLAFGVERLNVFDNFNDGFTVKSRKHIEVPKDYIIRNYSLVNEYEDEYDDTYDTRAVGNTAQNESVVADFKPFTTPRVLEKCKTKEAANQSESENEDTEVEQNGKDHFVQNPAELRAKAEQRRQAARGGKASANVIGKPKGQGQDKNVVHNRQQKNTHKAQHGNHNRRSGAQWKRNQGMVPS